MRFVFTVILLVCLGCTSYSHRKTDGEVYSILNAGQRRTKIDVGSLNIDKQTRPLPQTQPLQLDKKSAVDLALLHSPEYQAAKENLYLSAADVAQERYRFDVQFFGGDSIFYTAAGRLNGGTNTISHKPDINAKLLLATGGELAAGLANSMTWSFNGRSDWYADSILNVAFVQPLLRGAGRQMVLENLTQKERDFLCSMRQLAFYQQGFYTKLVTGSGAQGLPGGASSAPYTPLYSGGFYGLLAEQIRIQNQRQNIIGLEENLDRLQEMFEIGQSDAIQVEETRQNLLNSESSFLGRVSRYETSVDTYLRSLGLPPDTKVEIQDPLMDAFQLTSPSLAVLQKDLDALLTLIRKKNDPLPADLRRILHDIAERTKQEIEVLKTDIQKLDAAIPLRQDGLNILRQQLADKIVRGERIDKSVYDAAVFQERIKKLKNKDIPRCLKRLEESFQFMDSADIEGRQSSQNETALPTELNTLSDAEKIIAELRKKDPVRDKILQELLAFQYELTSLLLLQTRCRLETIVLQPMSMSPAEALQTASANRLDWENQKSQLGDVFRQIGIKADALQGVLNLTFDGSLGTLNKDGLDFGARTGALKVGAEWDSPLTRHNERLDLRRSEIAYQNAKRNYCAYVDSVNAELRNLLRTMEQNQIDFEIARNAVLIAAIRVDIMQLQMEQPPQRGTKIDTNTATQLVSALNGLLSSQNSFLDVWVAYQTQQMLLELNLGTMLLENGHYTAKPAAAQKNPVLHLAPELNTRYTD